MKELDLFDFLYNPYGPNGLEEEQEPQVLNLKYILEYCNEYSLESAPETIYHEWIQLLESQHLFVCEMILEPYMRVIERNTGKIVMEHNEQRQNINIEEEEK